MKKYHRKKGKIVAAITAASALTIAMGVTAIAAPFGGTPGDSGDVTSRPEIGIEQDTGFVQNRFDQFSFDGAENQGMPEFNGERPDDQPEFGDERPERMPEFNGERPDDLPQMNGERPMDMKGGPDNGQQFDMLVQDGTISQDTYDAIMEFMNENAPQKPDFDEKRPEMNGEKPDDTPEINGEKPDDVPDLLKDLLNAGIITQEEYETISASGFDMGPKGPAPFGDAQRPNQEMDQKDMSL